MRRNCPSWARLSRQLPIIACVASLAGCSAGPEGLLERGGAETIDTTEQAATTFPLADWVPWQMPIKVCVERGTLDPDDPDYFTDPVFLAFKLAIPLVLQDTWGRVPGISFTSSCSGTRLTIRILNGGGGGECGTGAGAVCYVHPVGDYGQLVHEVGHGLGLFHEHQRQDAVICPSEQALMDAWLRCLDAYEATPQQPCSVADYNRIFEDPNIGVPPVTEPTIITAEQAEAIVANFSGNFPDPTVVPLTYYDPQSVMNYCASEFGRSDGDYMPTGYDLLGVEMLYPLETGHPLGCSRGCVTTPTGVIVRTDGAVTSNWRARGALNVPMSLQPAHPASAQTINATSLPAGTATVTYEFNDPRGNRHSNTSVTLKSNAKHAAVALSNRML